MFYSSAAVLLTFLLFGSHTELFAEGFESMRENMVRDQIAARQVKDARVLEAMKKVKRHQFVPLALKPLAYSDRPLPIGEGQTISQPYIVALMTELLSIKPTNRILEVGTGSGYQAAILAELSQEVYSIEIIESLAASALERLKKLGYKNIFVRAGDGYLGWPEKAPFDGIIVTCAPDDIPKPLLAQLKTGGRMVIPVGDPPDQILYLVRKTEQGIEKERNIPVRFVPMTGLAEEVNSADSKERMD
jgi:protein-L-isoaspartate(D-aspartate) O-methyltransferase